MLWLSILDVKGATAHDERYAGTSVAVQVDDLPLDDETAVMDLRIRHSFSELGIGPNHAGFGVAQHSEVSPESRWRRW